MEDILISMKKSFYEKVDPRRRQEVSDSRMIQEDHAAMANLSPRFINKQFDPIKFNKFMTKSNSQPWDYEDQIEGL